MTIQIKIGEAGTIDVNEEALRAMPQVEAYIFTYGLKQMLNDVHASVTAKVEADADKRAAAKRALVEKKLASLMAGEVAQARATASGATPVEREMARIAEGEVVAILARKGKKLPSGSKEAKAKRVEIVAQYLAKHEERIRAEAERRMAETAELATDDDDLMAALEADTAEGEPKEETETEGEPEGETEEETPAE